MVIQIAREVTSQQYRPRRVGAQYPLNRASAPVGACMGLGPTVSMMAFKQSLSGYCDEMNPQLSK
jgi:hypothetical protein